MKRKMIEKTPPKERKCGGTALTATTQIVGDTLVLNFWAGVVLQWRYCIQESGKYAVFDGRWREEKIFYLLGGGIYYMSSKINKTRFDTKEDQDLTEKWLQEHDVTGRRNYKVWERIDGMERDWRWEYEARKESRRLDRVNERMLKIPDPPEDLISWTRERIGDPDYAFWDKDKETWNLTCCGRSRKRIKAKHREEITCPVCGKRITAIRRMKDIYRFERVLVLDTSPIGGVMRYFNVALWWSGKERKGTAGENVRILLDNEYRNRPVYWRDGEGYDNKRNHCQLRDYNYLTWLYDRGAEAAVKGTRFEPVGKLLAAMAGKRALYDGWLMEADRSNHVSVLEYLIKGRFFRLAEEWYGCRYCMDLEKRDIEGVFKIGDRQKINRIRDRNGGKLTLVWMQWSERNKKKVPEEFLNWAEKEKVYPDYGPWLFLRFSPEAAMHYIIRQQKESYKKSAKTVISQYEDYMDMCQKLGKDMGDEMVFRPRELKRRHDEAAMEIRFREAELDAAKYSKRFPEAEKVLKEVKANLEYEGQQFLIRVPDRIIDIVTEGRYLHHCAGATDRYFDRIASHETYIVFLRKAEEPEIPYYTVEVEPGGTIRQHRGMYDEEPDIETIKPFLREWQKEIKKRMKAKERERAKISAIKREENIKDLKAKNNTRVLQGLMEDFMEAI